MKKVFGLTTQQALENKAKGSNELTQREAESFWDMFKESLQDTWLNSDGGVGTGSGVLCYWSDLAGYGL